MRDKDTMKALEDTVFLMQFLYMNPDNRVKATNGLAKFVFRMDEDCHILATNENFPNHPEFDYSSSFDIPCMLGVIEQLQSQPPEMPNTHFKSRWDEIKTITGGIRALNFCHK